VRFLQDGRGTNPRAAIIAHGGEAAPSVAAFRAMTVERQAALLSFLSSL
jgi:CxxC motif-containing protein (DUF1111 family)